jgi:murein DD-endopeptidase
MNRRGFMTALSAGAAAMAQDSTPDISGTWQGTLSAPAGKLRVALDISKASDGLYIGKLTSLDQGGAKIPIDSIKVARNSVRLEVKMVSGVFEGTLDGDASKIAGTWTQGGPALPLEFTRSAEPTESAATGKAAAPRTFPFGLPLNLEVPTAPTAFTAEGKMHLVYELHITNFDVSGQNLRLKRIEVLDSGATVASFEGSDLMGILARVGGPGDDHRLLDAGRRAIAFLWVTVASPARAPSLLRHRITVGDQTLESSAIAVSPIKPAPLSSPLRGSGWMAANGPGNASPHRRAIICINGRVRIAQRFAIDWVKLGSDGKTFDGDEKQNKTHYAYGNDVLAVADAVVAAVKDGIPENVPGIASRAVPITLETIGGNHIILDFGGGEFGFYAHLQPASIRVKVGDRVKRGQSMALVGNSGNSTEPHLHFHVSDANSPLGSEGLPYALDAWRNEMPLRNARVNF